MAVTVDERKRARRNLAVMAVERHPGDLAAAEAWLRDLIRALGLDDVYRDPGACAVCGQEIPVHRTVRRPKDGTPDTCSTACARTRNLPRPTGGTRVATAH